MDMKLEVVVVPVPDVDRATQFYQALDRREDADSAAAYVVAEQYGAELPL
jgi:catechol 2,3-dioxygenase-like lactoylglutathione lyase family enzyme